MNAAEICTLISDVATAAAEAINGVNGPLVAVFALLASGRKLSELLRSKKTFMWKVLPGRTSYT